MKSREDNPSWWPEEPGMRKFYAGTIAVGAVAFIATMIVATAPKAAKKPKKVGLMVGPQCASYTITDIMSLRNHLRHEIRLAVKKGPVDPFNVTSKFLGSKRFSCTTYPLPVRSPGEAELYATIFKMVTEILTQEQLASVQQQDTYNNMVATWADSQVGGVDPGESSRA